MESWMERRHDLHSTSLKPADNIQQLSHTVLEKHRKLADCGVVAAPERAQTAGSTFTGTHTFPVGWRSQRDRATAVSISDIETCFNVSALEPADIDPTGRLDPYFPTNESARCQMSTAESQELTRILPATGPARKAAAAQLARVTGQQKNDWLRHSANALRQQTEGILQANRAGSPGGSRFRTDRRPD